MESRIAYHAQLAGLTERLEAMCRLTASAMEGATAALLQADLVLAEQVITDGDEITASGFDVEENAVAVLAFHAPVAGDLRTVVSAIQVTADLSRMGAAALDVAKTVRRHHPQQVSPAKACKYLAEMGQIAVGLGHGAADVLISHDPRTVAGMRREYEALDGLFRELFDILMTSECETATDVAVLGRSYERFADHAVHVSRRVIFQATDPAVDSPRACLPIGRPSLRRG